MMYINIKHIISVVDNYTERCRTFIEKKKDLKPVTKLDRDYLLKDLDETIACLQSLKNQCMKDGL